MLDEPLDAAAGAVTRPNQRAGAWVLAIAMSNPSSSPTPEHPAAEVGVCVRGEEHQGAAHVEAVAQGKHADDLLPAIERVCTRAGIGARDLGRVVVDIGPGGFTGLRIAVTAAKLLCEVTGAEAVGVPAWRIAGLNRDESVSRSLVCLASKGSRAHGTLLGAAGAGASGEGVSEAGASARVLGMISAEDLDGIAPGELIADSFLPEAMRRWAEERGVAVRGLRLDASRTLRASAGCAGVDPLALAPLYAREPDAVTQWRARHA